jgi:enoyl-CoA hydratase
VNAPGETPQPPSEAPEPPRGAPQTHGEPRSADQSAAADRATVSYKREGAAALVTIERPQRRNAVDGPTAAALHDAFMRFESESQARVLVLTGAGEQAFCAGADLKALESFVGRLDAPEGPLGITRLTPSKPTIAAISGYCLAGGLELALWCDLRVAAESSTLGLTERRFGVPLIDGGTQRLPRVVGLSRALELILTGRMVSATEALAIGLVSELVADGRHVARALELASELAEFPQQTLLADRRAVLAGVGTPLAQGLQIEAQSGPEVFEAALRGAARFAAGEGRGGAALPARGPRDAQSEGLAGTSSPAPEATTSAR